jgi:hypothetical protein
MAGGPQGSPPVRRTVGEPRKPVQRIQPHRWGSAGVLGLLVGVEPVPCAFALHRVVGAFCTSQSYGRHGAVMPALA